MRVLLVCGVLCVPLLAQARCFDFSHKVVKPRREVPPLEDGAELSELGTLRSGTVWTVVRSQVNKPIKRVYELLLDHENTRGEADEAIATSVKSDAYLALQDVKFRTSPLPLLDIRWTEVWAFALIRGTVEAPEEIVVSYEKTEGTNFIERLCGSVVVRRTGQGTTDVFWFEEAKVSRRSAEDTRATISGAVKQLREAK